MKYKYLSILFFLLASFTAVDIAPNPISANGIYTVDNCKIRMEWEIVEVDLFPKKSMVNCTFEMKNYGPVTELEVGFPVMDFHYWNIEGYSETDKANFEIQVNDKSLSKDDIKVSKALEPVYQEFMARITLEKEHDIKIDSTYKSHNVKYRKDGSLIFPKDLDQPKMQTVIDSIHRYYWPKTSLSMDLVAEFNALTNNGKFPWYVWDVKFAENETKTIKVSYELPSGLFGNGEYRYFKYILKTGAGWYKDIGKADIVLNLNGIPFKNIEDLQPNNYLLDKKNNQVKWSFKNIEPTEKDDIYLQYTIPKEKRRLERWLDKMGRN